MQPSRPVWPVAGLLALGQQTGHIITSPREVPPMTEPAPRHPWGLMWRDACDVCDQVWDTYAQALDQVAVLRGWGWTVQVHPCPTRQASGLWVVASVWHYPSMWSPGDLRCRGAPPL